MVFSVKMFEINANFTLTLRNGLSPSMIIVNAKRPHLTRKLFVTVSDDTHQEASSGEDQAQVH